MSESNRSRHEQLLADALRREAIDDRPEFSAALHVRLRDAVQEAQCHPADSHCPPLTIHGRPGYARCPARPLNHACYSPPTVHRAPLHFAGALTVLAAVALLAAILAWQWIGQPRVQAPPDDPRIADAEGPPAAPGDAEADFQQASELADQAVEGLDDLVDAALAAQSWAELDEDARAALSALADHLPQDLASALAVSEAPEM